MILSKTNDFVNYGKVQFQKCLPHCLNRLYFIDLLSLYPVLGPLLYMLQKTFCLIGILIV